MAVKDNVIPYENQSPTGFWIFEADTDTDITVYIQSVGGNLFFNINKHF